METVSIDEREINFEVERTNFPQLLNFAKNALISACRGNEIFKYFKTITFVFRGRYDIKEVDMDLIRAFRSDTTPAGSTINPHDVANGTNKIYIPLDSLIALVEDEHLSMWGIVPLSDKRFIREAYKELYTSAVHEAIHLWHYRNNIALNRLPKVEARLKKFGIILKEELNKYGGSERIASLLMVVRFHVDAFISKILAEGLAMYIENSAKYSITKKVFDALYSKAKFEIEEVRLHFLKTVEVFMHIIKEQKAILNETDIKTIKEFYEPCLFSPYDIGVHMVYTIFCTEPKMNIDKIARFSYAEFIVIYERCCIKLGVRPLVSLTSGIGIFDYKSVLGELYRIKTMIKKLNL